MTPEEILEDSKMIEREYRREVKDLLIISNMDILAKRIDQIKKSGSDNIKLLWVQAVKLQMERLEKILMENKD